MSITPLAAAARRDVDTIIGENVHRLMWRAQENQVTIARELGITQSALSNKLRGKRPWFAGEIQMLATRYGVAVGTLFRELPGLDSNQEPIGSRPARVVDLAAHREARKERGA